MARAPTLEEARHWFAEELRAIAHLADDRVVRAFAAIPRERFAGPGPWRLFHIIDGYWSTPDDDPRRLYHNVLIGLDEARGINIGEPVLWARHLDRIGIKDGDRVLQLGTGTGYYTAILAELVGPNGRVDGIEIEASLAATAERNLEPWPAAHVRHGDASEPIDGAWDLIVAFAGATTPLGWWVDALADGGRLLLPMTGARGRGGFMLRLDRRRAQRRGRGSHRKCAQRSCRTTGRPQPSPRPTRARRHLLAARRRLVPQQARAALTWRAR